MQQRIIQTVSTLTSLVAVLVTGCSSMNFGHGGGGKTVASLADTRAEVVKGRNDLSGTLATLQQIQKPDTNLQADFNKLKSEIKLVEAQRAQIFERAQDMRAHADEYSKQWQAEIMNISDPQLKATAQQRADRVRDRFGTIADLSNNAREAYDPLIKDIKDLEAYLSKNLSSSGVQAANATFTKVQQDGDALNKILDSLIEELNAVTARLERTSNKPA